MNRSRAPVARTRRSLAVAVSAVLIVALCGLAGSRVAQGATHVRQLPVTPVAGPSNLHRLGLTIQRSAMGWAGEWGSAPEAAVPPSDNRAPSSEVARSFTLTGADLYRL